MRTIIILLLLLMTLLLFFQSSTTAKNNTYAVVIGISNYESSNIEPLPSPKKDALTFTALLKSKAGGQLEDEQIRLLIEQEATAGKMVHAIDWLMESCQEGDKAIIWFSGYGTLNKKSNSPNYLMPFDVSYPFHSTSLFPFMKYIQQKMELANSKGIQLIFMTEIFEDVKFLNSQDKSPSAQAANTTDHLNEFLLKAQTDNRTALAGFKSQKEKRSINHYLVEGLLGLADFDLDKTIGVAEIQTWLKSRISFENVRESKFYFKTNTTAKPLFTVDSKSLKQLKNRKDDFLPAIVQLETNAYENKLLQQAKPETKQLFQDFVIAIQLGNLLSPENQSADAFYKELIHTTDIKKLQNALRRRLSAALQDKSQQAINSYLQTDAKELAIRWRYKDNYAQYPKYLSRAAELLGEKHFLASHLKAKQLYFEGVSIRLDGEKIHDNQACFENALAKQQYALQILPEGAFLYNEIGLLYWLLNQSDSATYHFHKATEWAPSWSIPWSNLCMTYGKKTDLDKALIFGQKAILLNPEYISGHINLGIIWMSKGNYRKADKFFKRTIELDPNYPFSYYNLACSRALRNQKNMAMKWLEMALKKGYSDFEHLEKDKDLDCLRDMSSYNKLIFQYIGIEKTSY